MKRKSGQRKGPAKKKRLSNDEITELVNNSQLDTESEVPLFEAAALEDPELGIRPESANCVLSESEEAMEESVSAPEHAVSVPDSVGEDNVGDCTTKRKAETGIDLLQQEKMEVAIKVPTLDLVENVPELSQMKTLDNDVVELSSDDEEENVVLKPRRKRFGRAKSSAWDHYVTSTENGRVSARCKSCGKKISAKADRLRSHTEDCTFKQLVRRRNADYFKTSVSAPVQTVSVPESSPNERNNGPRMSQSSIKDFFDIMTAEEKDEIDKMVAKFIFRKNLAFSITEDEAFIALLQSLRPSYHPPSRTGIGGKLLDVVYTEKKEEMSKYLSGKKVTIMQDGWSTNQNDPVLVHAVSDGRKTIFLNAIATEDNVKSSEYCFQVLAEAIEFAEKEFGVTVVGCVTDNCNTMKKMHKMVAENFPKFLVYGCNTHLLNLVGRDLTDENVMNSVLEVQRFFRSHHYESSRLKLLSGRRPVIPGDTRWNSQIGTFENYIKNQALYLGVTRDKKSQLYGKNTDVNKTLMDGNIYTHVVDMTAKLAPIAKLLDELQSDTARYTDAIHGWFDLEKKLPHDAEKREFKKRFRLSITDMGLAAYMLHPLHKGELLYGDYIERGRAWLSNKNPYYVVIASNLHAEDSGYFPASMLSKEVLKDVDPVNWWKAIAKSSSFIPNGFIDLVESLLILPASTSGLERYLSTMGSIMTKERNRLGVKKAGKLCFVNFHSK